MIYRYREAPPSFGREASHDWANRRGAFHTLFFGVNIADSF